MSLNSTSIYTGYWINWSNGRILGSTVTLSAQNGAILTSFIATFVALVGTQLWKILCFILHQTRVSQEPKDGLYHQHQNVFRNSNTPGEASWSFMLQSWHWWGRARHSLIRSIPWAVFSASYLIVSAVLSIFGSSEIAKAAGQDRLIQGSQCGYWAAENSTKSVGPFAAKLLNDSQNAAAFARNCYSGSLDPLQCNTYATPRIHWEGKNVDCPFEDRICWKNSTYQMDTGLIDSHFDLGMNAPQKDRLKFRRVTTCSVLGEEGYVSSSNDTMMVMWYYGPADGANYTMRYNKNWLSSGAPYSVSAISAAPGLWEPAPALNRTDADIQLVWISANAVIHETTVDDPVFSAHLPSAMQNEKMKETGEVYYEADYYLGIIACAEQYQICNGDKCTPLSSHDQLLSDSRGFSMAQRGTFERIAYATIFTPIAQAINNRGLTALRAAETLQGIVQAPLPPNQWEIEVSSWFDTGLVLLQSILRDYVAPTHIPPGSYVQEPQNTVDLAMCSNQKTQFTNGTISFSVLGLAIILIIGTLIMLASFCLEPVVGFIGLKSYRNWVLDDKLQLQRMVFEGRGIRWTNTEGGVPVTETPERFPTVASSAESQALMAGNQEEKTVGMDVIEIR